MYDVTRIEGQWYVIKKGGTGTRYDDNGNSYTIEEDTWELYTEVRTRSIAKELAALKNSQSDPNRVTEDEDPPKGEIPLKRAV